MRRLVVLCLLLSAGCGGVSGSGKAVQGKGGTRPGSGWAGLNEYVTVGDIAVAITVAVNTRPALPYDANTLYDPCLCVVVNVKNSHETAELQHITWALDDDAKVTDNTGKTYKRSIPPRGEFWGDQKASALVLPGQEFTQRLYYERPDPNIEFIRLEFPAKNIRAGGMIRFQIDKSAIKQGQS